MKNRLCVLMLIFVLASMFPVVSFAQKGGSGAQNITNTINTARFILFGGTYTIRGDSLPNGGKTGDRAVTAVFKLDTYTGKVWMLEVSADGRIQWVLVEDADVTVPEKESSRNENGGNQKGNLKSLKTLDE